MGSPQRFLQAKLPNLQAKAQLPQPFFVGEALQPFDHLCGPLDLHQQLCILTVLGAWTPYSRWSLTSVG